MVKKKVGLFKVMFFAVFLNVWFYGFYKLLIHFLVNKTTYVA